MEARILTRSATMRHRTKVQPSQTLASDQTQLLKQLMLEIMKSHTLPSDLMKRIKKNLVKMTNLKQVVLLRLKIQKPIVSQILILKSTAQRTEVRTISQDNFSSDSNMSLGAAHLELSGLLDTLERFLSFSITTETLFFKTKKRLRNPT